LTLQVFECLALKIHIIKFSRPAYQEYELLVDRYAQRLAGWYEVNRQEIRVSYQKHEAQAVQKILTPASGRLIVAVDEHGAQWSSTELAKKLEFWQADPGVKQLMFVIGGPYGLNDLIKEKCDLKWSLSKAVFTADMAWLLVWEQLYRASCINRGIAYHHE